MNSSLSSDAYSKFALIYGGEAVEFTLDVLSRNFSFKFNEKNFKESVAFEGVKKNTFGVIKSFLRIYTDFDVCLEQIKSSYTSKGQSTSESFKEYIQQNRLFVWCTLNEGMGKENIMEGHVFMDDLLLQQFIKDNPLFGNSPITCRFKTLTTMPTPENWKLLKDDQLMFFCREWECSFDRFMAGSSRNVVVQNAKT